MQKTIKHLIIIATFLMLISCGSKTEPYIINDDSYLYLPLKLNSEWTYQVDSTIFDNKGAVINDISRIVTEKIIDKFIDETGTDNYLVEQNIYNGQNLIHSKLFTYISDDNKIIKSEDNLKFIKLIFPVKNGSYWDGNELFDSDNTIIYIAGEPIKMYDLWNYRYAEIDGQFTVNGVLYDDVVTVLQTDTENSIEKRYSEEKFAKGKGLIYKKMTILNTQKIDNSIPWELKAEEGFILEKTLVSYKE